MAELFSNSYTGLEIAVIGMAGRFPGAKDLVEFWQNLRDGVESISFFTDQELLNAGTSPEELNNPQYVKAHGVLQGAELFDADLFGYSAREAEILDPQQRIFLESALEAIENAGYDPDRIHKSVGVFGGATMSTYLLNNLMANQRRLENASVLQIQLGNDKDYLTTRVSYKLNLEGPSFTVQTACSTSLVAIHLACQSLLGGECDMALAGGVSISIPQKSGYIYQAGHILSPDGHCRAFDAQAQGTVSGDGVGIVVLKRLADALEDGDTIRAVIKGTGINNDGSLKAGYTAPRKDGQAKLIRSVQVLAEVEPESITYFECHGTATPIGDPIEIAALNQAFHTSHKGFCALGSVKTNIGHLDAAAGVAGFIKTVLALENQQIPPSLHYTQPNPEIDFANSPFYVNQKLAEWKTGDTPRRAGVSSFGIGGTNAHVLLEEALQQTPTQSSRPYHLLRISAKTPTALDAASENLAQSIQQHPEYSLEDIAHTLQVGRKIFNYRRFVVCRDGEDVAAALKSPERMLTSFQETSQRPVVFLFPGQGEQHINMGRELYQTEPVFREHINQCAQILNPLLGIDLLFTLYPTVDLQESYASLLDQPRLAQPATFAVEYALAKLWMTWGIQPEAMLGHSLGEYVAACLAGVFTLEDALTLVTQRGQLFEQIPLGAMLSVSLSDIDVQTFLADDLWLTAINGPALCTISGTPAAIDRLEKSLAEQGIRSSRVNVSFAAHSPQVEIILPEFRKYIERINLQEPRIPYISSLTGTWITPFDATNPDYWLRHFRQPVRFASGVNELLKNRQRIFLEMGAKHTLSTCVQQSASNGTPVTTLTSLPHPKNATNESEHLLTSIGKLWLAGSDIDWSKFYATKKPRRIHLPSYPFERRKYWIEPDRETSQTMKSPHHTSSDPEELSNTSTDSGLYSRPTLRNPYLAPRNELEELLIGFWQNALGFQPIGILDNFFELGGHSLIVAQLLRKMAEAFPIELPPEIIFVHQNVAELADALEKMLLEKLETLSETEAQELLTAIHGKL